MRRGFLWGAILAFLLTASGCDTATSPLSDSLRLSVSTTRTGAESLTFRHTVENTGPEDRTLTFSSSQSFDIEVRSLGGELLWRWSHDKYFMTVMWSIPLAAGESHAGETEWDLKGNDAGLLAPGVYWCRFSITCSPRRPGLVTEFRLTL